MTGAPWSCSGATLGNLAATAPAPFVAARFQDGGAEPAVCDDEVGRRSRARRRIDVEVAAGRQSAPASAKDDQLLTPGAPESRERPAAPAASGQRYAGRSATPLARIEGAAPH